MEVIEISFKKTRPSSYPLENYLLAKRLCKKKSKKKRKKKGRKSQRTKSLNDSSEKLSFNLNNHSNNRKNFKKTEKGHATERYGSTQRFILRQNFKCSGIQDVK